MWLYKYDIHLNGGGGPRKWNNCETIAELSDRDRTIISIYLASGNWFQNRNRYCIISTDLWLNSLHRKLITLHLIALHFTKDYDGKRLQSKEPKSVEGLHWKYGPPLESKLVEARDIGFPVNSSGDWVEYYLYRQTLIVRSGNDRILINSSMITTSIREVVKQCINFI